ncbi:MAG: thiamine pyrophosphate-binding protein [Alphaproteobacteria bacterium]
MERISGGRALTRSLIANGVDTVFALPGVQLDHLFNAFHDEGNALRIVNARHEQGCAYMAFGYAWAGGRPGVCAVVPGPGLLNTTAAICSAWAVNAPMLTISGQIPSYAIGKGVGHLHEIPDQLATMKTLTKWAHRIEHPSNAPQAVNEAFRIMQSGRPGPVEIEMALDTLAQVGAVEQLPAAEPDAPPPVDTDAIEKAAKLLGAAERPIIMVGGGAMDAGPELLALAELLQAPVIAHRTGKGIVDGRHWLSHALVGGYRLWPQADAVLAVGTRFLQKQMWGVDKNLPVVRLDIDPVEINRNGPPQVAICADAKQGLAALVDAVAKHNRKRDSREEELTTLKQETRAFLEEKLGTQVAYADAIRAALPEDGIYVDDLTQVSYVARESFEMYRPRSFVTTGYQGTLGAGYGTALGVKVACPDRPVVSVNGDGGFMYNVQELATAVLYNIPVVGIVFADGAFGNVKRMQQELHGGRVLATDLRNPDFVAMAESFGAIGLRANGPDELKGAIEKGLGAGGPVLIEVPVGDVKFNDPWQHIRPPKLRG